MTRCIGHLDDTYAASPSPDIYKERLILPAEFDTLLTDQFTDLLIKSRMGKLLAHKLRQISSLHQIPKIRTSSGISLDPSRLIMSLHDWKQFFH